MFNSAADHDLGRGAPQDDQAPSGNPTPSVEDAVEAARRTS